ncbi:hypothetical protein FRC14_001541 [Serendipita sp. 396]|nr:hypothetical protein FRC14_001541 [Serendipita sp. 396]KAG9052231.1 hypothetical protein FS842_010289 [Serendipita sp. 407]
MRVTLSTTLTLVTCAVGTVLASFDAASYHMPRSALASDEYSFDQLADAYEQGLSDPRLPKRAIVKRFDPNTQATSKIGVFDTNTGESQGFLTIFGDFIRNTTTDPTLFQYSKLAGVGDKIDLEVSIQGGVVTKQLVVATKNTATTGLNSPNASPHTKSDLYAVAWPLRTPSGSTPTLDAIHETWFESAVWSVASDKTLSCTWINPDGSPVPLQPYFVVGQLHLSPSTAQLRPWGGPWYDIRNVTLKLVD